MSRILCLCIILFSTQAWPQDAQSTKNLDSQATKLDVLISSLYGQLGCKVKFSVWPVEFFSKLEPELCMNEIDYLPNTNTLRMKFVISDNHHLVSGFDKFEEKDKLVSISDIAILMELKIKSVIRRSSLLLGVYQTKMEYHIAHKGYVASRNNKGEIQSARYEVKRF